jgi:hypothetical protein
MKVPAQNGGGNLSLHYDSLRNISCAHDTANGRRVLVGRALATEFLTLNTDENVRAYLVDAEGKKKRRRRDVHRKIEETIFNRSEDFCVLNGGIAIVARDYTADDKIKTLTLLNPSIINGAQTQGVLRDSAAAFENSGDSFPEMYVTFEVIVTRSEDLIADISIARNFQEDVQNISIASRKGVLDDLRAALKKAIKADVEIRMRETDLSDDSIDTEKLLQVMMALAPAEMLKGTKVGDRESKAYTYSQKATCLKDFSSVHDAAKDEKAGPDAALYEFFLQIAPTAYQLHTKWKTHQGFRGTGIRKIERDGGQIVEVPDGIIFPIISSLSVFATKGKSGWTISQPVQLSDAELIQAAKTAYYEIADRNPQTMGKKAACYSSLLSITSIYKKFTS